MANYGGCGRTNYFRVKDKTKFDEWLGKFGDLSAHPPSKENADQSYIAIQHDGEYGDIPEFIYDEEKDEDIPVDFMKELSEHLVDGEVAIFMHIGNEKLRYLCGYAVAVNSQGKTRRVSLQDIYKKAAKLGDNVTEASW